jgi:large subunit ribosomal protein L24
MTMNIRKGDRVKVITGKDKGVESVVMRALPAKHKIVVEKVAIVKKAQRPTQANPQGGLIEKEMPIDVSNVMLICPKCKRPVRVSSHSEDGKKIRTCKKCGAEIK